MRKLCAAVLVCAGFCAQAAAAQLVTQQPQQNSKSIVANGVNYAASADGLRMALAEAPSGSLIDATALQGPVIAEGLPIVISQPSTLTLCGSQITGTADPVIEISSSDVSIVGCNASTTTITQTIPTGNAIHLDPGIAHIHISGLGMIPGGKTRDEENFHQGNCVLAGTGSGSQAPNAVLSDITLDGNSCSGTGNNGFVLRYVNDSRVTNNQFNSTGECLAQVLLVTSKNNVIQGNTFRDTGGCANAVYTRPIVTDVNDPSQGNTIAANSIVGTYTFEGINVFGAQTAVTGNVITISNAADNSSCIGIEQVTSVPDTVATTYNDTVTGNTCKISGHGGSGNYGIEFVGAGSQALTITDVAFSGNVFDLSGITGRSVNADGYGVVGYVSGVSINGDIVNCSPHTDQGRGILLNAPTQSDVTISGVIISGCGGQGIFNSAQRTKIIASTIMRTSEDAAGIYTPAGVDNGVDAQIVGNYLYENAGRAIDIKSGGGAGQGTVIADNMEYRNGHKDVLPEDPGQSVNKACVLVSPPAPPSAAAAPTPVKICPVGGEPTPIVR
jgi:hypothetical protein